MSLRTPLSNALGLGAAKSGASHWWMQRLTSIALIPLVLWLAFSVALLGTADYASVIAWIRSPMATVLLIVLIIAVFYHMALGLQVIIEDYVHVEWLKLTSIIAVKFGSALLGVSGVIAVLRIAFGAV